MINDQIIYSEKVKRNKSFLLSVIQYIVHYGVLCCIPCNLGKVYFNSFMSVLD